MRLEHESGILLVTDIDPRFLESLDGAQLGSALAYIAIDPLPEASFDLIHARLVLIHIPERERVRTRLVAATWDLPPSGLNLDKLTLAKERKLNARFR